MLQDTHFIESYLSPSDWFLPLGSINVSTAIEQQQQQQHHPTYEKHIIIRLGIALFATMLIGWTILSNTLVIRVVSRHSKLRTTSNILVGHLAFTDFLIAIIGMSVSACIDCLGYWPWPARLCIIWILLNRFTYSASVWSTAAIAIDRYVATAFPQWYCTQLRHYPKRMLYCIALVWLIATVTCIPSLVVINRKQHQIEAVARRNGNPQCMVYHSPTYASYIAGCSFIVPMLIMLGFYMRTIVLVRRQRRNMVPKPMKRFNPEEDGDESAESEDDENDQTSGKVCLEILKCNKVQRLSIPFEPRIPSSLIDDDEINKEMENNMNGESAHTKAQRPKVINHRIEREQRATRLIIMLVILLGIAWIPYIVMYLWFASTKMDLQSYAYYVIGRVALWNGYVNSGLNPIAYTMFNHGLRRAICQCKSYHR